MSSLDGKFLRVSLAEETITVPTLKEEADFRLQLTGQKIYETALCPVLLFDVLNDREQRIGIASIVVGPDHPSLIFTGHVCVMLSRELSEPVLLSRIGKPLIQCAFDLGLYLVRIVVPASDTVSIAACRLLRPHSESTLVDTKQGTHTTFLFYP